MLYKTVNIRRRYTRKRDTDFNGRKGASMCVKGRIVRGHI